MSIFDSEGDRIAQQKLGIDVGKRTKAELYEDAHARHKTIRKVHRRHLNPKISTPVREAVIKTTVVGAITGVSVLGGGKLDRGEHNVAPGYIPAASRGIGIYENPNKIKPPQEISLKDTEVAPLPVPQQPSVSPASEVNPSLSIEDNIIKSLSEKALRAVPDKLREDAKIAIPLIVKALRDEGYTSNEVIAYALATAEWESKFHPGLEFNAADQAEANNYHGGEKYAGRGYIQLTGKMNYEEIGKYLGLDLVNEPDLVLQPEIAARVLAAYFKLHKTAVDAEKEQFVEARRTVNGWEFKDPDLKSRPYDIAETAQIYLVILR